MSRILRGIYIGDDLDRAEVLDMALQDWGYALSGPRVKTAKEFLDALEESDWEVVFCGFSLEGFDAPSALRVLQHSGIEIPFIVISDPRDQEYSAAMLRAGASAFVSEKSSLKLGTAVDRGLREAQDRRLSARLDVS